MVLTLGSCTPRLIGGIDPASLDPDADRTFIDKAADIYFAGYGAVTNSYVDPVEPATLALASMDGVSRLDDRFRLVQRANRVAIHFDGRSVAELVAPDGDDVGGWAQTTAVAIETARRTSDKVGKAGDSALFEATFDSMTESLDRYSRYENEKEGRANRASRQGYSGIGAGLIEVEEPAGVMISKVFEGSPADQAGVHEGDRIMRVDGVETEGMDVGEVATLMRGPTGTTVSVRFERAGKPLDLDIERARVIEQTVFYERVGDVAYFRISYFNAGTTRGLSKKLDEARSEIGPEMTGIVLDLRQNRGGNLPQSLEVADLFIDTGKILSTRGRTRQSQRDYVASPREDSGHKPMVVLIDGGSASASEIVASALQDSGRALVVGTRSYGKGTIQNIVELPDHTYLIFTSARMHAPSGYTLSHFGVFPSICTRDSYGKKDAESADLHLDQITSNEALKLRRRADQLETSEKAKLEDYCTGAHPPSADDSDVRIARRLLESDELYRRAADAAQVALRATGASTGPASE